MSRQLSIFTISSESVQVFEADGEANPEEETMSPEEVDATKTKQVSLDPVTYLNNQEI